LNIVDSYSGSPHSGPYESSPRTREGIMANYVEPPEVSGRMRADNVGVDLRPRLARQFSRMNEAHGRIRAELLRLANVKMRKPRKRAT